jgi:hypothetical protein
MPKEGGRATALRNLSRMRLKAKERTKQTIGDGVHPLFSALCMSTPSHQGWREAMVCFHGPCQAGGISKVGGDPIDRNCNSSPGNAGRRSTRGMTEPSCPIERIFHPLPQASMGGDDVPLEFRLGSRLRLHVSESSIGRGREVW